VFMVSPPESLPGRLGFDFRQCSTCLGAHQACYAFGVGQLVPVLAGVEGSAPFIKPYGFDINISVRNINFNFNKINLRIEASWMLNPMKIYWHWTLVRL